MAKKLTIEYCLEYASDNGFNLLTKRYENNYTKMKFKHILCNKKFKSSWTSFKSGKIKCPYCANNMKLTIFECKKRAKKRGYRIESSEYFRNGDKLEFVHIGCGYKFNMKWNNFNNGQNCPRCSNEVKPTFEERSEYAEGRGYQLVSKKYVNARKKVKLKHLLCGKIIDILWMNFHNAEQGCSFCYGKNKPKIKDCKKYAKEQGYELLDNKYVNQKHKMNFKHLLCGETYISTWGYFKSERRCPICKESRGERKIGLFLKSKKVKFIRQHRYKDCIYKKPLPFDFYIPKLNLLIEYQGEQHYKPVSFFGISKEEADENFELQKIKDKIKLNYARKNKINLLIIKYDKIKEIEKILDKEVLNGKYL